MKSGGFLRIPLVAWEAGAIRLFNNAVPAKLRTNCPTNAAYQSVSFVRVLWDNDDQRRVATSKHKKPDYLA